MNIDEQKEIGMHDIFEQGYFAPSVGDAPRPAVLVIHAWWGLNDFFRGFADRLAQAGFVAFAPDLYAGKVAVTIDEAQALRSGANRKQTRQMLHAAVDGLMQHPATTGQPVGVVGFSLGANYALSLLEERPDQIGAVVAFYGTRGGAYDQTGAAFLGHYAETDAYVARSGVIKLQKAFEKAGLMATFHEYPGTQHWFMESNQPQAYNPQAADQAWQRTTAFLHGQLR